MNDLSSKDHITKFVTSLKDLKDALEFDLKKAIQKGKLSMAFGARGKPGQAASYDSGFRIINITKTNGDGSVAHEFGHFIDHLCSELNANRDRSHFISRNPKGLFVKPVQNLISAITRKENGEKTDFYKNVQKISGKDFSSIQEYFARPFESYVEDSLEKKTMKNTYLVAPNKMSKV
ncbi:LPD1 domain-containing protein [Leptospira mayottensis]|uniref:Large polyvalent protein-associated domain-containing protein n=3 Tax=Leptospira mayottensis TaxID=1137606 RepID=A0AA87MSR5_9LEPT|nr:LPD1 domain-containing protein [Leptospira mayottensis]AZQ01602.1 hypothetical protein LEP1GSC190_05755 [Leptospira mayottensis 200901116]AXR61946.1 hypothetical protein DQM68_15970 [Leptospira mayottensis]AXR65859.1 hypothetical protein DQM28_18305 [Leptospira mayottensis]EKS01723.1 hypothetical protein LEP1GSC125_4046 [Leptospira mayottensis 200901122]TGM95297.1 hypothetical protein EHR03_16610 [Leptospira mayottensis]